MTLASQYERSKYNATKVPSPNWNIPGLEKFEEVTRIAYDKHSKGGFDEAMLYAEDTYGFDPLASVKIKELASIITHSYSSNEMFGTTADKLDKFAENLKSTVDPSPSFNLVLSLSKNFQHLFQAMARDFDLKFDSLDKMPDNRFCVTRGIFCFQNDTLNDSYRTFLQIVSILPLLVLEQLLEFSQEAILEDCDGTDVIGCVLATLLVAYVVYEVSLFISSTVCPVTCDDCGSATAIRALVDEADLCNFAGFEATGSPFEDVLRFVWTVEIPGEPSREFNTFSSRTLTKSMLVAAYPSFDTHSEINVSVDVVCDQDMMFPWPRNSPERFVKEDFVNRGLPSIIPPLNDLYYFPAGTEICFTRTAGNDLWVEEGWITSSGGSPSSGPPTSQFCTQFEGSSTQGISLRSRNTCTGQIVESNFSFLVLDI